MIHSKPELIIVDFRKELFCKIARSVLPMVPQKVHDNKQG